MVVQFFLSSFSMLITTKLMHLETHMLIYSDLGGMCYWIFDQQKFPKIILLVLYLFSVVCVPGAIWQLFTFEQLDISKAFTLPRNRIYPAYN